MGDKPDASSGGLRMGLQDWNKPTGGDECFFGERTLICAACGGAKAPLGLPDWGKASGPTSLLPCVGDIDGRFLMGDGRLWFEWFE